MSLSFDGGQSWQVIKSFIGGCVKPDPSSDQEFSFTIPKGTPGGDALLAWLGFFLFPTLSPTNPVLDYRSWYNNQGNREFYMNCAVVTISGGRRALMPREEFNALPAAVKKRALGPNIFVANLGNGCKTVEGTDVEFPDAGSNVERAGTGKTAAPEGSCGKVVISGDGGGGGQDCAYWRSQGYICSQASGLSARRKGLTLFATLVVGLLAMLLG
jgi:hypothetical protein